MPVSVRVDRQGRLVIPQGERERLGVRQGGTLELTPTPEGLLLERQRRATVGVGADGLPVVKIDELDTVPNEVAVEAIHDQRDGR